MQFYQAMFGVGLAGWLAAGVCISIIGFKNSIWYATRRSVWQKLNPKDLKLAKTAAVLFMFGILCFIIGVLTQ